MNSSMLFFYSVSAILILVGIIYDFAYFRRRCKAFDRRCNDYFVVSRAFLFSGITVLIFTFIVTVVRWW